jgi:hypothetical protein
VTIGRVNGPFCPVDLLAKLLEAGEYKRTPASVVQEDGSETDAVLGCAFLICWLIMRATGLATGV